jgi:gas vesicle protein
MTITPPEGGAPRTTPLYDETISTPAYEEIREQPPVFEHDDATTGASGSTGAAGQAKERAQQTKGAAKDAAADVKDTAKDAGAKVASTGKDQASRVAKDALGQARDLYGQATSQLSEQAGTQQQKAAGTLHTFADDLGEMGNQGGSGLASELVQSLETRARGVAEWLEDRQPEDVLDEVKRFAAQRPGLFIGLAAVTGIVAARLTKALVAEAKESSEAEADGSIGDVR